MLEEKRYICEIGKRMYKRGLVAANDGNISVKTSNGNLLITPTGISKGFMEPEMIVRINREGEKLDKNAPDPSSEAKMHIKVYQERDEVGAVVHAHPPHATAFAVAGKPLDKKILPEAIISLGTVPVAGYATPSTEEIPASIEEFLLDYNAVLLSNHGVLTWGEDLKQAYFRMETVEFYARIIMLTENLSERELTEEQITKLMNAFDIK